MEGSESNSSLHVTKGNIMPNISKVTVLAAGFLTHFAMAHKNFKAIKFIVNTTLQILCCMKNQCI